MGDTHLHTLARSTANPMTDNRKSTLPDQVSRSSETAVLDGAFFKRPSSDIDISASSKPPPWFSVD